MAPDDNVSTKTFIDKNGDWYFLKTQLFFPRKITFNDMQYYSLKVSTYIKNKKRKDAETMIFNTEGSIPSSGKKHSLADALPEHFEAVERLKLMYKKN